MANFPLIRDLGWAFKSKFLSSEAEEMDDRFTKVPNFAEGSSHTSTGKVELYGEGAEVTPFVSDDADLRIDSDHEVRWLAGSSLVVMPGATEVTIASSASFTANLTMAGTGAFLTINASNFLDIKASAQGIVRAGGLFTIQGASGNPGTLAIANFGVLTLQSGAMQTVLSGATLYQASGSTWEVVSGCILSATWSAGSLTITSGLSVSATFNAATMAWTNSTLTIGANSTVTHNAPETRGGATTRTTGAYWDQRLGTASGVGTIDPSDVDILQITGAATITLDTPANTAINHLVFVDGWTTPAGFSLKVGSTVIFATSAATGAGCIVYWSGGGGGTWRVMQPTGAFATP
jgi:hypothetical protein